MGYDWVNVAVFSIWSGMSAVSSLPTRPVGRALIVGTPPCRAEALAVLQRLGYDCAEVDEPYAAMLELSQRPLVYRALVLSLQSVFREELAMIATIRRRLPHLAVWLTQTDGRHAALAEAMRLGADGLLDEEGIHRTATASPPPPQPPPAPIIEQEHPQREDVDAEADLPADLIAEPVLTAEELRALLQEQPSMPPAGGSEGE
jgi:hypothetical protein